MSGTAPVVSVIIPVLNTERFLARSIRSILEQTVRDLELIVIDNGSTDATPDIIRQASSDRRVRPLTLPEPDLVAALNLGVESARAPLVARMDADDVAHPRRLERQLAFLARSPEVAVVSCSYRRIDEDGAVIDRVRSPTRAEGLLHLMRHYSVLLSPGTTMRRAPVLDAGGFHAAYPLAEDYDLWLRLLDAGHELEALRAPLMDYRLVGTGITLSKGAAQRDRAARAVFESRLRNVGIDSDRIEETEDTELATLIPPGRLVGFRLVREGLDEQHLATADATALVAVEQRVRPLVPPDVPDGDLALLAYRIATRARELRQPTRAARWYALALRSHRPLILAMLLRSVRSLLGRV